MFTFQMGPQLFRATGTHNSSLTELAFHRFGFSPTDRGSMSAGLAPQPGILKYFLKNVVPAENIKNLSP
jgi:hypothetical protein